MPVPENPNYAQWKDILKEELSNLDDNSILIGHSLGGSVLLKYLSEENCEPSISSLFIMGAPYWGLDEDWPSKEFQLSDDFASRLPEISQIHLYQSRNDEIVPFVHFECYAYKLPHAKTKILENSGHLFQQDLPELVYDIKSSK
ncbi:alpha/beta hydrolase [Paraliobacillus salinarum]|uniref:alpha/beta hydrolase n=1 Tax=Paraliobacillus salinarum TaxID=1158996 RepID=UPI001FE2D8A8|nr:alpha/beta hydrolase [Paraliobacillus salinarum]